MLTAHGVSHPGHVRKINEDCWLSDLDLGLFVVTDGMGGHNAGEVASQLAMEAIRGFMQRTRGGEDVTWPYGIDPKLSFHANRLMTAIKLANRRVFKAGESRDAYTGMGTTVVAALVVEGRLIFAGVGDSRIYSYAAGRLVQITKDDSWVATMLAAQDGTAQAIPPNHPMRHVLTNVIGAREQIDVHMTERPLVDAEVLLLCSDGLRDELDDAAVATIMGRETEAAPMAEHLMEAALAGRAGDNITVVVVSHRA
jgi:serine/threonine protein phosphatase PrpC